MSFIKTGKFSILALLALPLSVLGFSTGPVVQRTGAPVDGGLTCTACHRTFAADSDPRGSVKITASAYTPGVTQTIQITISHPDQKRWGFQLIGRLASDASKQAGTFTPGALVRVRCSNTVDAPCNGAPEYVDHSNAQVTAVGAGFTYTVDWTPPATAVGDIIFYAAGNAANGDGTNAGDRIYTTSLIIPQATCGLAGTPTIAAAVSAASGSQAVAPGSFISLYGTGFQPAGLTRGIYPADLGSGSFPTKLSCFAVEVDGQRAPMSYVSDKQINVQMPFNASATGASIRVILNPDTGAAIQSSPVVAQPGTYAPDLFVIDPAKHAAAQFAATYQLISDPTLNSAGQPAKSGDFIILYATGLGDTSPHFNAGALASGTPRTLVVPTVTIGGVAVPPADMLYCGLVPTAISGLYQINLKVPAGVSPGDAPVRVTIAGVTSPTGPTIRIAP